LIYTTNVYNFTRKYSISKVHLAIKLKQEVTTTSNVTDLFHCGVIPSEIIPKCNEEFVQYGHIKK